MTNALCLRFSAGLLLGAALLHALLASWLSIRSGLSLMAPYVVLAAATWGMRTPWILWLALGTLLLLETCVVVALLSAASSISAVMVPAFAIAASAVQIPITVLVAVVRHFQAAS